MVCWILFFPKPFLLFLVSIKWRVKTKGTPHQRVILPSPIRGKSPLRHLGPFCNPHEAWARLTFCRFWVLNILWHHPDLLTSNQSFKIVMKSVKENCSSYYFELSCLYCPVLPRRLSFLRALIRALSISRPPTHCLGVGGLEMPGI